MENIKGKVVIITGASSGIGEATARLLADYGAKVVLAARREDRLQSVVNGIKQNGGEAVSVRADVVSSQDMINLARFAVDKYGRIDVLVNNAGIMPNSRMNELRVEEWEQMIDVNIKGVLNGIAAVLPVMREQQSGHVINLSSTAGYHVSATSAVYAATKFAVRAISEGLRLEESGASGIRSTVVSPGLTNTELFSSITSPEVKAMASQIGDLGIAPSSIARAIAFAINEPDDALVSEIMVRPAALA
ncbi:SDR family oxidoreductase [Paenibacillus glycanilyticus]|uniref:SDR family oxidoreductase n=1 Tax=Paenibacillus glycanilyticus TaxID=126569 RepID=UPI0019101582|nr:SDR family oxidoreductase [Paenibacillus glycanilyticus]